MTVMEAVRRKTAKTRAQGISIDQQGKQGMFQQAGKGLMAKPLLYLDVVNFSKHHTDLKYLASSQRQPTALTSPQPQTEFAI